MYAAFSHGKTPVSMDTALLKWMKTFVTDKHVRVRTKGCGFLSKTVFVVSLSSALLQGSILYSTPKLHWFCYTEARMQSQSVKASCLCMLQSVFSVSLPMRRFCFQQCVCVQYDCPCFSEEFNVLIYCFYHWRSLSCHKSYAVCKCVAYLSVCWHSRCKWFVCFLIKLINLSSSLDKTWFWG